AKPAAPSAPPPLPKAALDLPAEKVSTKDAIKYPPSIQFDNAPPAKPIADLPTPPAPRAPVNNPPPLPSADAPKPAAATTGSYKLHVRMGGNLGPRFEVREGDALLLKVYCEHIDMQGSQQGSNAIPGLTATGKVRFSGSGVSGTCDGLSIASAKGEVTLKGNVKLTCYRGNSSSQLAGESMTFQLKGSADVPVKSRAATKVIDTPTNLTPERVHGGIQ